LEVEPPNTYKKNNGLPWFTYFTLLHSFDIFSLDLTWLVTMSVMGLASSLLLDAAPGEVGSLRICEA
jgi:hypothetical protein